MYSLFKPSTSSFKGKIQHKPKKNRMGKRRARKATKQLGKNLAMTAVLVRFLNAAFCAFPWTTCFALDHPSWAY